MQCESNSKGDDDETECAKLVPHLRTSPIFHIFAKHSKKGFLFC